MLRKIPNETGEIYVKVFYSSFATTLELVFTVARIRITFEVKMEVSKRENVRKKWWISNVSDVFLLANFCSTSHPSYVRCYTLLAFMYVLLLSVLASPRLFLAEFFWNVRQLNFHEIRSLGEILCSYGWESEINCCLDTFKYQEVLFVTN